MTALAPAAGVTARPDTRVRPLQGFGNLLRKELQDWTRTRRAVVVGVASLSMATLTVLVPLLVRATAGPTAAAELSLDPTVNVLAGWNGSFVPVAIILTTMGLLALERDQGTLAWTVTKPVTRTAVLAAKWVAGFLALAVVTVLVPLAAQVAVATVAYGALPDLAVIGRFGLLYLTIPALYVTLTVAVGTVVRPTPGVAGVAFVVAFAPIMLGMIVRDLAPFLPTSMDRWALGVVQGTQSSITEPLSWLISVVALAVIGVLAFDRQEI
jgi:ABC-type transport system involved in multi-copper enzyme maturation permease subunit